MQKQDSIFEPDDFMRTKDGLFRGYLPSPAKHKIVLQSDRRQTMAERNDISGLLAFIGREGDWRDRLQNVVAEHLMPALEEFEIDHDDLIDLLGEQ